MYDEHGLRHVVDLRLVNTFGEHDPDYKFRARRPRYWAKYGAAAFPKLVKSMARLGSTP